ncbi:GAF domain-containing protein [Candidatus Deferrimicrobium sp.]|uniref:GAF domain-containing protein n=1 Tax=Candidatus Deferrimicrobium sp. TaxID=3060586 RepID=UPI002ED44705
MVKSPNTRFSLLARIIEISNSNIQVENRLKHISDFLQRETRADCVCIFRRDLRGEDLTPWVSSCMEIEECALMDFVVRPGEGVSGKAARKRAPVFFPNVKTNPPAPAVPQELRDFTSILSVPITDDVYLYGVMNFSTLAAASYTEDDLGFLGSVAMEVAGTIRNSRLYLDARKRVSELITLNEIGNAISSTFEVKGTLGYVAKTTVRLLSADACTVRLAVEGRGALKVVLDEGYNRPIFRRELRSVGKELAQRIHSEKRPLLINGPEDSPLHSALAAHGITSFLGLPIVSQGRSLGTISYYSASPRMRFDMEGVHLMQTVCSQLANMLGNEAILRNAQRLAQENQVKVQRISTLYDVARALMSTVKMERLLSIMLYALISPGGLNFSRAILFLTSEDGEGLSARMAMGPRDRKEARRIGRFPRGLLGDGATGAAGEEIRSLLWSNVEELRIPMAGATCLVAKAVKEKRPVRTESGCGTPEDANEAAPTPRGGFCGSHPAAFAAVPLVVKGEARGAIYVDNLFQGRPITEEDIQLLTTFASNACLAMENASLYESLEDALKTVRTTQDQLLQSEKLMALGEMAAKIAHEIKNPLTAIGGFARRIASPKPGKGKPPVERYARIILKEVDRLERIINETLYFSREMVPTFRIANLNNEVREAVSLFREELEDARISTVIDLFSDLPVISVDPDQLRQVLWNLVSNAIQAMEGGGTLTIATRPALPEEGVGVVFQVSDTGGGIPHDVVHNIFNPFFTTKAKGTGLGLAIVHAIVEKHGGTIHLDNREGVGVTFSVFLPLFPKEGGTRERILEQLRKGGTNGIGTTANQG